MSCRTFVRIFFVCVGAAAVPVISFATNEAPQTFTLDGQLVQVGSNLPLLDTNAKITVQIMDPSKTCLLYEESQQPVNTSGTNGYYNIVVGSSFPSAKRTVNDPSLSMVQVFQNASPVTANNVPGQTCAGGIYTPVGGAIRYFRLIVTPSATSIADTLLPDTIMNSVPNATVAESLQGLGPTSLLQVKTSGSNVLSQTNLENVFTTTNYPNLMSLLSIPATSSVVQTPTNGGASLPSIAGNPSSPAAGQIWYDSGSGVLKYYDGAVKTLSSSGSIGNQTANTVYAGPTSGGAAAPTFRALTAADLPTTGATGSFVNGGNSFGVTGNIGTNDNFDLNLKTNNATKMTVQAGGNVGIGTTNPGQKLSVAGTIESTSGGIKFPDGTTQLSASTQATTRVTTVGGRSGCTYVQPDAASSDRVCVEAGYTKARGTFTKAFYGSGTIYSEYNGSTWICTSQGASIWYVLDAVECL